VALACACAVVANAFTPSGQPLATGQNKFLGCAYSSAQAPFFENYFNQITAENGGKWGTVEYTRDGTMNWTEADAAYAYAKARGFKYRHHILVWGSQQPSWISSLTTEQKREEIEEWFAAVASRYPDLDYVEVVNEPLHAPPNGETISFSTTKAANYSDALGGTGASGWEWILQSFRLARQYFPGKKLVLNEYGVLGDTSLTNQYLAIINLLKAENLIDVIAVQCHAFETNTDYGRTTATLSANLNTLAATGLPIMITEMDIDGPTDQIQLAEYQRVFPIFWNHPSVIGITLWGYRPGLWRNDQGANLVLADNTERPAMQWLRTFVGNFPPVVTSSQTFAVQTSAVNGTPVGTVLATDANAGTTLQGWAITGGSGASYFAINATSGQVTVSNRAGLDLVGVDSYTLQVTVGDGIATSTAATVMILTPASAPSVTTQPTAAAVRNGGSTSFAFAVSSPVQPTFQWQVSTDGGVAWSDLVNGGGYSSVTDGTLRLTGVTAAMNGHRFRCVATNLAGVVTSNEVILTVARRVGVDFNQDGRGDLILQNAVTGEWKVWLMNGATKSGEVSLKTMSLDWEIAGQGDFNLDGSTDLVLQNLVTGERGIWLLSGSKVLRWVSFGSLAPEWELVGTGDFNADGNVDIVLYNHNTGARGVWMMEGSNVREWVKLPVVATGWEIVAIGDFNLDGMSDLVWRSLKTNQCVVWLMNGVNSAQTGSLGVVAPEWRIAGTSDINGDGKDDLLLENTATGARGAWVMDGTKVQSWVGLGTLSQEWQFGRTSVLRALARAADFDRDGRTDLVWQNAVTGEWKIWLMNGAAKTGELALPTMTLDWEIVGTGDFNVDGNTDLVLQNLATGERGIWLLRGSTPSKWVSFGFLSRDWDLVGTGDFNADGCVDIILENPTTGQRGVWIMDRGRVCEWSLLPSVAIGWSIVASGDFDGDGQTDLVWRNTSTNECRVGLMNGVTAGPMGSLGTVAPELRIAGAADINQDGKDDLLLENTTTGARGAWTMDGKRVTGWISFGSVPIAWRIAN